MGTKKIISKEMTFIHFGKRLESYIVIWILIDNILIDWNMLGICGLDINIVVQRNAYTVWPRARPRPIVQRPISVNPGLNYHPGFFFFYSKALSQLIFSFLLRVSNDDNNQIVDKKNLTEFAF